MGNAFTSLVTTAVLLAGAVVSLPLSAAPPAQAQAAPTSWLDRSKPVNWNKPGMAVPGALAGQGLEANLGRYGGTLRPANLVVPVITHVVTNWLSSIVWKLRDCPDLSGKATAY